MQPKTVRSAKTASRELAPFFATIASCSILFTPLARAEIDEYKIGVGDSLSLWVQNAPELNMRLPVGIDGAIVVPLAGEIHAAGQTLNDVRASVESKLGQKSILKNSPDGRALSLTIGKDQIVLQIAEYRPVYVSGDVAKPGSQQYRPGMTIRQAIAMAGDYDLLRSTGSAPVLDAFDLRSQQETLWIAYAQLVANERRVQAELQSAEELKVEMDL
jgi:polysaccharide biosynthesis/export protein